MTNNFFDGVVFSKVRARFGGNIRMIVTGSAPIQEHVLQFLRCALCTPIIEAYGQTESCAASFGGHVFEIEGGHVGGPALCTEFKLEDLPDIGYTRDSKPYPAGEICIRGTTCTKGYFKNFTKTQETIDAQGWLHTGDVGVRMENGAIKIVDRVKNIFKLSQGEYIVPEKLERLYELPNIVM